MQNYDFTIIDIGSTYTKVRVFNKNTLVGTAQSPTTLENIEIGINKGEKKIKETLNHDYKSDHTLCTSSAAGGLRMVALGYMVRVTAKAAKEVAMNAGAKVLEIISNEDPKDYRVQILKEINPDIILLAGGTDFGDEESIKENAHLIVESKVKSMVIIAGNIVAHDDVEKILNKGNIPNIKVSNIMPTIHELRVKEAREAIHYEFIRQITKAKGLVNLQNRITNDKIVPTPGAVLLGAELLAKGTHKKKGLGSLVVVDIGGATTDIHSIIPELEKLSEEERGLIVTNEKQLSFRTVEGNLGLRVSAKGILETVNEEIVLEKYSLPSDKDTREKLKEYCEMIDKNTQYVPQNDFEKELDYALARTAAEIALKRHAGFISKEYDPIMGIVPGTPIGRDLRVVRRVIGVGGIFSHIPLEESKRILKMAIENPGISLLPRDPIIKIDDQYILYAAGIISMIDKEYAFDILEKYFIK